MSRTRRPPMPKAATTGSLLRQFLQQSGFAEKLQAYESMRAWGDVVGPLINAHTQPRRIRDSILEVRVDQAVWMQQLQLMKPKILCRLNERLGNAVIKDIFLRLGRIEPGAAAAQPEERRSFPPLPAEELARIKAAVAPLHDEELRRELQQLLIKQAQLDRSRHQD